MASERAKELAAKQKAELKAAKLAKKNSTNPKDWGWFKQFVQTYKMTVEVDHTARWLLPAVFVGVAVIVSLVGIWMEPWYVWLLLGVMMGLTATLYLLINRAKRASFTRHKGQPGSAEIALSLLNKKKWTSSPAITMTKQLDVVHRAVGPAGIVLIGEGAPARLHAILSSEVKKHEQVAYGTPVSTVIMGDEEGQVPLEKLGKHLSRMPKALTGLQVSEVNQRLKALDAIRPRVPVPRGPLVMPKGAAKSLRGR